MLQASSQVPLPAVTVPAPPSLPPVATSVSEPPGEGGIEVNGESISHAESINHEGEKAYHAKQYDKALQLYQEAIKNNPNYGQAYSNLGLLYQKIGNQSAALAACQKSIDVASGPNANTIKANSTYTIAKLYEEQGQWKNALDAFQTAYSYKPNNAYTQGIARMKEKLGQ